MSETSNLLACLEHYDKEIRVYKRHLEATEARRVAVLQRIAENIKAGKTSGNVGLDAALVLRNTTDDTVVQTYNEISEALRGKSRQMIMVSWFRRHLVRHVFGGESKYETVACTRVGVLNGESLQLQKPAQWLPLKTGFVFFDNAGSLTQAYWSNEPLLQFETGNIDYMHEKWLQSWQEHLRIGDEAVTRWLEENRMGHLVGTLYEKLGLLRLTPE